LVAPGGEDAARHPLRHPRHRSHRPGAARHRAEAARKRRLALSAGAAALVAAVGVGGWLAVSGDDPAPPQDSKQSGPRTP
ncbi:serine/threonine protein kinase, partial [Streptomyces sp. NPDC046685]